MASVREHYQNHLASIYEWMSEDPQVSKKDFAEYFKGLHFSPGTKVALDLGAGTGPHALALAEIGYEVTAVDFDPTLLAGLRASSVNLPVRIIEADIRDFSKFKDTQPSLLLCMGDTLTHLESFSQTERFLENCCEILSPGGMLLLSFRDYSARLNGDARFIPVKSDRDRILTCFLEYFPTTVRVTDLLHERQGDIWTQKVSSYDKIRISDTEVCDILVANQLRVVRQDLQNGMIVLVAEK